MLTSERAKEISGLVKSRHKFSTRESVSGGKLRAKQAAEWRVQNPTPDEKKVRDILTELGVQFVPEYPIRTRDNMVQYLDVFIPGKNVAIEVDGSHGWHGYHLSKTEIYDEIKSRWAQENGVLILVVRPSQAGNLKNTIQKFLEV